MPETQCDWLADLNPQQRQAATCGDGPTLIVAGAGSGKTRTLAYRVAWLVAQGVPPERILLLTFTRRAAEEMLKRAAGALKDSVATARVWGGTFHAIANRLLRIYAKAAKLPQDFTIIDQADAEDLIDILRNELKLGAKGKRFPRKSTCLSIYSRRVNGSEDLETVLKRCFPWCVEWAADLKPLFKAYAIRKQKQGLLDYDDLLLYWRLLLDDPKIAASMGGRFDHILVDEYQDTNRLQAETLQGMRRENRNLMAVGDDAQSIYSFRSATVRNMLDFGTDFPGAAIIKLEQNYRSVPPILETANLLIAQAKELYPKALWSTRTGGQKPRLITCRDEAHQDEVVTAQVIEHYEQGIPLRNQAVLFRAGHHSASLELALTAKKIPFRKYGGLRFLEAAHVKDLICLLRLRENPQDEMAWFRILQLLPGVGPASAARIFGQVAGAADQAKALLASKAPTPARELVQALAELLRDLASLPNTGPAVEIERIRRFYRPVLERVYDNVEARDSDLEHLAQIATRFKSRAAFLADLVLDPPVSTGDLAGPPVLDEDWLVLSTIHSAKGCEWDAVYLIHAADGNLPSDMATGNPADIEEELRLCYVALTRAKDFLYVTWPLRYYHHGSRTSDKHSFAQCSRFFTPEVRAAMEEVTQGAVEGADASVPTDAQTDVASRLQQMWE